MNLKKLSIKELKKLGFNVSKEISLPESIIEARKKSIYNKNRNMWLGDAHRQRISAKNLPTLDLYSDYIFAHGLNTGFQDVYNDEKGLGALENILFNTNKNMEISATRPLEEIGEYGVYIKGDLKASYDRDAYTAFYDSDTYSSIVNSKTGEKYRRNYAPTYEEKKIINDIRKYKRINPIELKKMGINPELSLDRHYFSENTLKELGIRPELNARTTKKDLHNEYSIKGLNDDIYALQNEEALFSYTESIISNPVVDSIWYNGKDFEGFKKTLFDNPKIKEAIEERGIKILDISQIREMMSDRKIPRQMLDPFNGKYTDYSKIDYKSALNVLHEEAILDNVKHDLFQIEMRNVEKQIGKITSQDKAIYKEAFNKAQIDSFSYPLSILDLSSIKKNENISDKFRDYISDKSRDVLKLKSAKFYKEIKDLENGKKYYSQVMNFKGNTISEKEKKFISSYNIAKITNKNLEEYEGLENIISIRQSHYNDVLANRNNFLQQIKKKYNIPISNKSTSTKEKNKNKSENINKNQNKQIRDTDVFKFENGAIHKHISFDDGSAVNILFDTDGKIGYKSYRDKSLNEYSVSYDNNGNIKNETFAQDGDWAGTVFYDEDLNPMDIITNSNFNSDKAKGIKNETNKTWQDLGLDGINDILLDMNYNSFENIDNQKTKQTKQTEQFNSNQTKKSKENPYYQNNGKIENEITGARKLEEALNKEKGKIIRTGDKNPEIMSKNKKTKNNQKNKTKSLTYKDYKDFIEKKFTNEEEIGEAFNAFMNNALTKEGETLYGYLDKEGNIKFAVNSDNKFQSSKHQQDSHRQLKKMYNQEEWRQKAIDALKEQGYELKDYDPKDYVDAFSFPIEYREGFEDYVSEPEQSKPEPEQPQPDNTTNDSSENTNSEDTDNTNNIETETTEDTQDDSTNTSEESNTESNEQEPENVQSDSDEELSEEEKQKIEEERKKAEAEKKQAEHEERQKQRQERRDKREISKRDKEYEKEWRDNYDELQKIEKEYKQKKNELKEKRKKDKNSPEVKKLEKELAELKSKKQKQKWKTTQSKRRYNSRNNENNIINDLSSILSENTNLQQEINNLKNQYPDIDKTIDDLVNNIDEIGSNPEINKLYNDLDNVKKKINQNEKKIFKNKKREESLRNLYEKKYGSKNRLDQLGNKKFLKGFGLNEIFTLYNTVSTYKDQRREGHNAISSSAKAGTELLLSESLGFGQYMALSLIRELPTATVKGSSAIFKETRRMNSAARFQIFGDADFQDTQQLATMRQSGMELAKMSQYRLEQTLMGNEARYLHK